MSRSTAPNAADMRRRLLRDLLLVVLVTTGTILAITAALTAQVRKEITWSYISQTMDQVSEEFRRSFDPLTRSLLIARQWGLSGQLAMADIEGLNSRFMPILEQTPWVSAMLIADTTGSEYFLLKDGQQWLTRSTPAAGVGESIWRRWQGPDRMSEEWKEASDYDPRTRPWFEGALNMPAEDGVFWTHPYVFLTRKEPGVTGAVHWSEARAPEVTRVLAFDVLLRDVADSVSRMRAGSGGRAFLFNGDGALYIPGPENERPGLFSSHSSFFSSALHPGGIAVFDAAQAWFKAGKPSNDPLAFISDNQKWWADYKPFYPESEALWFGVAVPESDFLGAVSQRWLLISLVGTVLLLGGIGAALVLTRRYSHRIKRLPKLSIDTSDYGNEIYALIRDGESDTLEFKSTMRMNLRTGKAGKEIELAWLKAVVGFMNTDGGILLIGVDDSGEILGIEPDGFENEDKCRLHFKNLLNQHIGLEYSKFLQFHVQAVEGKTVAAVECRRSKDPAFLHAKGTESFYIRSGPASVELSISQSLKYIEARH